MTSSTLLSPEFGSFRPLIVGLGGTMRPRSSSEAALRLALDAAEKLGAKTQLFAGADLDLPIFSPEHTERSPAAAALIAALRRSDGIIVASPGYHGSISGLVKNALDYVEDMRDDARVYFEGRPVGCIVSAQGWQATGSTLAALRSIIHALRGWPTPLGVTINSAETRFTPDGACPDAKVLQGLNEMAAQIMSFVGKRHGKSAAVKIGEDKSRVKREVVCANNR